MKVPISEWESISWINATFEQDDQKGENQARSKVYQPFTVRSGDSGTCRLSFDAKAPVVDGIAPPTAARAYNQTLTASSFDVIRQSDLRRKTWRTSRVTYTVG